MSAYDLVIACLANEARLVALDGGLPLGFKTARYTVITTDGRLDERRMVVSWFGAQALKPLLHD